MNTKKYILISGSLGTFVLLILFASQETFCYETTWCRNSWDIINTTGTFLFFTIPLFILSLITYRMKDEVFKSWWSFARWWLLVIVGSTLFLENASGGGTLGMNKDFTILILGLLYTIFIVTSLVKILRAYLRTR